MRAAPTAPLVQQISAMTTAATMTKTANTLMTGNGLSSLAAAAAGTRVAPTAPPVQQIAATTMTATATKTTNTLTTGSGLLSLAAAAAGTANLGGVKRSADQALVGKGSRVVEVEMVTKPALAKVVNIATTVPVAERIQRIEEKDPKAVSGQTQEANTTTNESAETTAPWTSGEAGKVSAGTIDVEMEEVTGLIFLVHYPKFTPNQSQRESTCSGMTLNWMWLLVKRRTRSLHYQKFCLTFGRRYAMRTRNW